MGTNCALLVADLLMFCYERNFMISLSETQADIIEAINTTSRHEDDLLNTNNPYFEGMVNIFIRFGTKLHRRIVGIPMGTDSALLVADVFMFCYKRTFMISLSETQADIIEAINSNSRYEDDLLNINNLYFERMVTHNYPHELQLNKANSADTEAVLDFHLLISNGFVSSKTMTNAMILILTLLIFRLDGDVPHSFLWCLHISIYSVC